MCYPVCGMLHLKELLLLIGKSRPCPLPYVRHHITILSQNIKVVCHVHVTIAMSVLLCRATVTMWRCFNSVNKVCNDILYAKSM